QHARGGRGCGVRATVTARGGEVSEWGAPARRSRIRDPAGGRVQPPFTRQVAQSPHGGTRVLNEEEVMFDRKLGALAVATVLGAALIAAPAGARMGGGGVGGRGGGGGRCPAAHGGA